MKKYQKPKLLLLSLRGNEQLCGSCSSNGGLPISGNAILSRELDTMFGNRDGVFTKEESNNCFGKEECKSRKNQLESYCLFTSSEQGNQSLAWS